MTSLVPYSAPTPAVPTTALSPLGAYRNQKALAVHARKTDFLVRSAMIDATAGAVVADDQLRTELALYLHGLDLAGDDAGARYLVARKVATFAESNNARLRELFG